LLFTISNLQLPPTTTTYNTRAIGPTTIFQFDISNLQFSIATQGWDTGILLLILRNASPFFKGGLLKQCTVDSNLLNSLIGPIC
jgi:hypothetical protein